MRNQIIQPQITLKRKTQKLMMGETTYCNLADEEVRAGKDQEEMR